MIKPEMNFIKVTIANVNVVLKSLINRKADKISTELLKYVGDCSEN